MMQAPPRATTPRAKTGIQVLDDRLQGGFPRPSTLLLFSDKPTEKRLFGENFAIQGVKAGETSLYVDFFRAPQLARGELKRFGPSDSTRLVLVDATSSQLLLPSRERYHIDDIDSLENIRKTIIAATEAERPARIVVDSMEFLMDRFPKEDVLRLWRELIDAARATGAVICFLFINWTLMERDLEEIRAMSDFVVEFQSSVRGRRRDSDELDPVRVPRPRRADGVLPADPRDGALQRREIDGREGAVREINQHRPDGDHGRIRLWKRERHRNRSGDFRDARPRTI